MSADGITTTTSKKIPLRGGGFALVLRIPDAEAVVHGFDFQGTVERTGTLELWQIDGAYREDGRDHPLDLMLETEARS